MSNIDKDIEIVEELIKASREVQEEQFCELIGIKQIQAISSVVNELKRIKSLDINSLVEDYETGQFIDKNIVREKINKRQFELQKEHKDFKDDVRLNTLQEIYYME